MLLMTSCLLLTMFFISFPCAVRGQLLAGSECNNCRVVDDPQHHQIGDLSERPWSTVSVRRDSGLVP